MPYFVDPCKAAESANVGIPDVINLLNIGNGDLPSVQRRYEEL